MNGRGDTWKQEAGEEAQKAQTPKVAEARRKNYLKRKRHYKVKVAGMFRNGNRKQRITNDELDMMVELTQAKNDLVLQRISEQNQLSSEDSEKPVRWKDDRKTYHQNYYYETLKQSDTCED